MSPSLNFGTGSIGGFGHIGGAVHPVGNRRPVLLGDRLDQLPQAFVLADGDGEANTLPKPRIFYILDSTGTSLGATT